MNFEGFFSAPHCSGKMDPNWKRFFGNQNLGSYFPFREHKIPPPRKSWKVTQKLQFGPPRDRPENYQKFRCAARKSPKQKNGQPFPFVHEKKQQKTELQRIGADRAQNIGGPDSRKLSELCVSPFSKENRQNGPKALSTKPGFGHSAESAKLDAVQKAPNRGKKSIHHQRGTPLFSVCRPTPRSQSKKSYGVYHFPWKTREKGIHHRSGKKGIHHRASDPEKEKKEGLHGGGVYFFLPCQKVRVRQDSGGQK